jgi:hypothetical protein
MTDDQLIDYLRTSSDPDDRAESLDSTACACEY